MKIKILAILLLAGLFSTAAPAFAGCIPYCMSGTIPPTNVFTATSTGDVTGYFVQGGFASGGGAGDLDLVGMLDVTSSTFSGWLFNNQTSLAGDVADFGLVTAGDTLVFELQNVSLGSVIFASQPSLSSDGTNHAYATAFGGGVLNGANIPAGTYVGMEDLPACCSDFNYNDDSFVFVGVASSTPEPGSLALMGSGMLGLYSVIRRKLNR